MPAARGGGKARRGQGHLRQRPARHLAGDVALLNQPPKKYIGVAPRGEVKKAEEAREKGDPREGREDTQRRDRAEANYSSVAGGMSNKQRLYTLEKDQAENLANDERMRSDIYDNNELAKRTARELDKVTRTMENMQERLNKLESREKNNKSRSNKDNLMSNHVQGGDPAVQDRQARRGHDDDIARRRTK